MKKLKLWLSFKCNSFYVWIHMNPRIFVVVAFSIYMTIRWNTTIAYAGGMSSKPIVHAGVEYVANKSIPALENPVIKSTPSVMGGPLNTVSPWAKEFTAVNSSKIDINNAMLIKKQATELELTKNLAAYSQTSLSDIINRTYFAKSIAANKEFLITIDSAKEISSSARDEFFEAIRRATTEQAAIKTSLMPKYVEQPIIIKVNGVKYGSYLLQTDAGPRVKIQDQWVFFRELGGSYILEGAVDNRKPIIHLLNEWQHPADSAVSMKHRVSTPVQDHISAVDFNHSVVKDSHIKAPVEQKTNSFVNDNPMPNSDSWNRFVRRFKNPAHLSAAQQKKAAWDMISQIRFNSETISKATDFWSKKK